MSKKVGKSDIRFWLTKQNTHNSSNNNSNNSHNNNNSNGYNDHEMNSNGNDLNKKSQSTGVFSNENKYNNGKSSGWKFKKHGESKYKSGSEPANCSNLQKDNTDTEMNFYTKSFVNKNKNNNNNNNNAMSSNNNNINRNDNENENGNENDNGSESGASLHSSSYEPSVDGDIEPITIPLPHKQKRRWSKIENFLKNVKFQDTNKLIQALYALAQTPGRKRKLCCTGLRTYLDNYLSQSERNKFFNVTLPFIQECCVNLKYEFPSEEIHLFPIGFNGSIELTEKQIASLLAMSFWGIHTWNRGRTFPHFSINHLFGINQNVGFAKMQCIFNYFYNLCVEYNQNPNNNNNNNSNKNQQSQTRSILFYRHILSDYELKTLFADNETLSKCKKGLCEIEFRMDGRIEDTTEDCIEIDFANKFIGGGVLGHGCVQEEIRFLLSPECLVSLLLFEEMRVNESIAIVGTKRFNECDGYGKSFKWKSNFIDTTQIRPVINNNNSNNDSKQDCNDDMNMNTNDNNNSNNNSKTNNKKNGKKKRREPMNFNYNLTANNNQSVRNCNSIIAIDAVNYSRYNESRQFSVSQMKRELMKAYCGFSIDPRICHLIPNNEMNNANDNNNDNKSKKGKKKSNNKYSIATGNWGCGVFRGDFELKFIIQWIACSLTNDKKLIYFSFGDAGCKYFESFIQIMTDDTYNVTIGDLWKYLLNYSKLIDNSNTHSKIPSVFEYIISFYKNEELVANPLFVDDVNLDALNDIYDASNSSAMLQEILDSDFQNGNQNQNDKNNGNDNKNNGESKQEKEKTKYVSDDDKLNPALSEDEDSFDDNELMDSEDELLTGKSTNDNNDNDANDTNDKNASNDNDVSMQDS